MRVAGTAVLLREERAELEVLLIRRPAGGSFPGAWVFPGGVVEPGDRRPGATESEDARRAAVRETIEEIGLHASGLALLSRWTPPDEAPKRVRTWFFLAAEFRGEATPAPGEVADWCWIRPMDALTQHADGAIELYPPTWVTLHGLSGCPDLESALAAATEPESFDTRLIPSASGPMFVWAGDVEHPDGGDGLHRLHAGDRPWQYIR